MEAEFGQGGVEHGVPVTVDGGVGDGFVGVGQVCGGVVDHEHVPRAGEPVQVHGEVLLLDHVRQSLLGQIPLAPVPDLTDEPRGDGGQEVVERIQLVVPVGT